MYSTIQDNLTRLARLSSLREEKLIEYEGEYTPDIEAIDAEIDFIKDLLQGEGIDALGRWLKSKEDEVKTWKAEKAMAARRQKAAEETVDFIKMKISEIMKMTGAEKIKGSYYGFTAYTSERTSVDMDELNERWKGIAEKGAREMGLPGYIDVELKTSVTKIQDWAPTHDGQGIAFLQTDTADAVRFTKPRKAKED